ncbi:unnamed protein product [Acanthoscelides obtectus]|uniref:Uncharacterized protein n=1 Tax=Acanthoscelides obtectus TaxID=200917 RepID=A0A9P0Q8I7_ACAOB|nr:unnamed protein product [Acanthoscelides obtectus]CAK1630017.1 hypothetical protein AOBTE_LOCUS6103 [Acanthoscelides obtectus]
MIVLTRNLQKFRSTRRQSTNNLIVIIYFLNLNSNISLCQIFCMTL